MLNWRELMGYDEEEGQEVLQGWYLDTPSAVWTIKVAVGGYALGYVYLVREGGQATVPVSKYPTRRAAEKTPWIGADEGVLTCVGTLQKVLEGATMERLVGTRWRGLFEESP